MGPLSILSAAATVANVASGLRGNKKNAQPASREEQRGYGSLPVWARELFDAQYNGGIHQLLKSPQFHTYIPQELAPLNQFQQDSLNQGGQGIQDINKNLSQYQNPYNQFVKDEINREADISKNGLLGQASRQGIGSLNNSALGTQLAGNDETRQRLIKEANYQGYQQALGLRRQTLADMLGAGSALQEQQQNQLNTNYTNAQGQNNMQLSKLSTLGGLLNPLLNGGSAYATGETPAVGNSLSRFGGFAESLSKGFSDGNGLGQLYNSGAPHQGQYGPPQPGLFNNLGNWFTR